MSVIYYYHIHIDQTGQEQQAWSNTPVEYDRGKTGYFSDRIYHARNFNARFYVVTFGYEKAWSKKLLEDRIIDRYTVHIVFDGKCSVNGTPMKKGQLFIVQPYEKHTIRQDDLHPSTLGWIALSGKELEMMIEILHLPKESPLTIPENRLKQIEDLFLDTVYQDHSDLELPYFLFSRFFQVMSLSRVPYITGYDTNNLHLRNAILFINVHFAENITVADVANAVNLSTSHLRNLYLSELGYSPQDAIIAKRISVAKALLQANELTIQSVAEACGYTDQSAFSKRFKREVGMSPNQYRKYSLNKERQEN